MTKFNLYVIKLFIKNTLLVQVFVAIISLIANTFQHTKMLRDHDISFLTLIIYDLMKTPYLLYSTMPMTIVISTMLVIVILLKNNELIAYVSLGGKIRNLAYPFLISGIFISALLYISVDVINPKVMLERERFKYENIENRQFKVSGKLSDMWLKETEDSFINITVMDPTAKKLIGITEYHLDDKFQVEQIITYDSAEFINGKWLEHNKKIFTMSPVPKLTSEYSEISEERELFDELTSLPVLNPKFLSMREIRKTAHILKKQNLNTTKYDLQLFKSYSHAISVMVIILVIFPLCIGFNRNQSYIVVASKSLFTGFAYWILMASCQSLGKTGLLNPFIASFLPIVVFTVLALILIYRRERAL